jgi:hypothetical protein
MVMVKIRGPGTDWEAVVLPLNYARNSLILLAKSVLELDLGTFWVPASRPRPAH